MTLIYDTNGPNATSERSKYYAGRAGKTTQYGGKNNNQARVRTGTDRNGNPIWKYFVNDSGGADGKGNGGGSRRGGGGGGGGGGSGKPKNGPLNLRVYHPNDYSAKGIRARATQQVNAQNREAYAASNISRNSADSMYEQNARGLDYQEGVDRRGLESEYGGVVSQNANTSLNRGMGFGQGYLNAQTSAGIAHEQTVSDLMNQYLVQRQNALQERDTVYGNMDEQDRVTRANRVSTINALFAQYEDTAYNRYLKGEALRQTENSSVNAARTAKWQARYGG